MGSKGKNDKEEPKGTKVVWDIVLGRIEGLCNKWEIHEGTVRVGDLKDNEAFGKELGEVWMEWESKVNEWWSEVCGKPKEAGVC